MASSPWRTRLLLILLSGAFALILLAALEGGLRLIGLGRKDPLRSELKYQQLYLPALQSDTRADGTAILTPIDSRVPYQEVLREKPENSLRVFTFGGSATAGLGYSPNVTFARHLREMLARAYPERLVEVINLGIVAISSRQVMQLVADTVQNYDPDVLVIYSGNNEFLEVHAKKYAEVHTTLLTSVVNFIRDTNLFRLLGGSKKPEPPSAAEQGLSDEELRVTQHRIIQDVKMTPEELVAVFDTYEQNITRIVQGAASAKVPAVVMTVGSNWKWRGRNDLPEGWIEELAGETAAGGPSALAAAKAALEEKLGNAPAIERSELLFRRAVIQERQGQFTAAREDYLAAMNEDPHLRRCTTAQNDRIRQLAAARDLPFVDTVRVLEEHADQAIVGFGEYYDYVHFTPKGAALTAAALLTEMQRKGILPPASFDGSAYVRAELEEIATAEQDFLAVDDWLGFSFTKGLLGDRDLWKYEKMLRELDERIESDPTDWRARAYRGNARSFSIFADDDAAEDYRAALKHGGDLPAVHANLERLLAR